MSTPEQGNNDRLASELENSFEPKPRNLSGRKWGEHKNPTPLTLAESQKLVAKGQEILDSGVFDAAFSLDSLLPGFDDLTIGDTISDDSVDVHADVEKKLFAESISAAVNQLEERLQRVIRMRFFEEKSTSEICQELGISDTRVATLTERALQKLKEILSGEREFVRKDPDVVSFERIRDSISIFPESDQELLNDAFGTRTPNWAELAVKYNSTPQGIASTARMLLRTATQMTISKKKEVNEYERVRDVRYGTLNQPKSDVANVPTGVNKPELFIEGKFLNVDGFEIVEELFRNIAASCHVGGRSLVKQLYPRVFFGDETMTDIERQIFLGKRSLTNESEFPEMCRIWGLSPREGEDIYKAAEYKYYSFQID